MKKIVSGALVLCVMACFATTAWSDDATGKLLTQMFPKLKFDSVGPSRVKGLYEVVAGNQIVYFAPDEGILIFGQMIDKTEKNLTAERIAEVVAQKAKDLPLDKAVKIGSGKHTVIEITDPDCPYCRKGEEFFSTRTDVTRFAFLFPLAMHPDAENKSRHILCAKDRAAELEAVMKGAIDGQKYETCKADDVEELLKLHKSVGDKMGVTGTPFYIVDGQPVPGFDANRIQQILSK